ncbi:MAG: glycerol kinase GlpK [Pseudomonadota bacterium]|nr:glycerol kinase GlpK [Pseudomonadota bacterium]
MATARTILAIDQGTTSSRAIVFDESGRPRARAQQEFRQIYPQGGWVEHDPEDIWSSTLAVCRQALAQTDAGAVAAIGITNQRETVVLWDRATGRPVHNAIVWQDRRTADLCHRLKEQGHEGRVTETSGLLLDPYFSASKLAWLLDNVAGARDKAQRGELAFGTIDTFLLWRLTGGRMHATDASNASRTLLFNIHTQDWDPWLLELFAIPRQVMPEIMDCADDFGQTTPELFGRAVPIGGMAGDQQAAVIGQACVEPGMLKSTYGTGCFVVLNTGDRPVASRNRLLTTVAYRLDGKATYALEGSIFVAGSAIQWLRDGIRVIQSAAQTEAMASGLRSNNGVYLVPAFTGLGAPHWDPHARGAVFGLTRGSGPEELVRAALESVCYQTRDLLTAMANDGAVSPRALRVDGGMVANDWLLQCLADLTGVAVERPVVTETTALGAACLAGLRAGLYGSLDDIKQHWQRDAVFQPALAAAERDRLVRGWDKAVACAREFAR